MYIQDLLAGLRRRWYVVLEGLFLTGVLAVAAFKLIPVSYEAQGSVLLLPPQIAVTPVDNPYLYLGGLNQALDVLVRTMNSDEVRSPIQAGRTDIRFTIGADGNSSGAMMTVVVDAAAADPTIATLNAVLAEAPTVMALIQDNLNIAANSRIGVLQIDVDTTPSLDAQNRNRTALVAVAFGVVTTILLTGLVDGVLLRHKRRKLEAFDRRLLAGRDAALQPPDAVASNPEPLETSEAHR